MFENAKHVIFFASLDASALKGTNRPTRFNSITSMQLTNTHTHTHTHTLASYKVYLFIFYKIEILL